MAITMTETAMHERHYSRRNARHLRLSLDLVFVVVGVLVLVTTWILQRLLKQKTRSSFGDHQVAVERKSYMFINSSEIDFEQTMVRTICIQQSTGVSFLFLWGILYLVGMPNIGQVS